MPMKKVSIVVLFIISACSTSKQVSKTTTLPQNIVINGKPYAEKITIKYVPTSLTARLLLAFTSLIVIYFLIIEWKKALSSLLS